MLVFSLVVTTIASVSQNYILNRVSKTEIRSKEDVYYFNAVIAFVCVLFFGVMLLKGTMSLFTAALGIVFGLMSALGSIYKMRALSEGPMNVTVLITTASMIIPTLSGIFFGEPFSLRKLLTVLVLLGFIYLSLDESGEAKYSRKWFLYTLFSFVTCGLIGVLQKVHQTSAHSTEAAGFLLVAFAFTYFYNRLQVRRDVSTLHFSKKNIVFAVICGVCTFCMHYINLTLSGIIPSQLFFPLVNGSSMVLSQIMCVVLFREIPTKRQLVGLIGGIAALIAICLV